MTDPRYPGPNQPYSGQPYIGQPYSGQPYSGQPYSGQPDPYAPPAPYGQPDPYAPSQPAYGQPPDDPPPYGQAPNDPAYGQSQYGQPQYGQAQYGQPSNPYGGYPQPTPYQAPPPAKGGSGKVIAAVLGVVGLLAVVGIGAAILLAGKSKPTPAAAGPGTSAAASGQPSAAQPSAQPSHQPTVQTTDSMYAKVGDCLGGQTMDSTTATEVTDVSIVACGSADAKYKVVGIVANKTEAQFNSDDTICDGYPTAVSTLWQGHTGSAGKVLCLADAKKK